MFTKKYLSGYELKKIWKYYLFSKKKKKTPFKIFTLSPKWLRAEISPLVWDDNKLQDITSSHGNSCLIVTAYVIG